MNSVGAAAAKIQKMPYADRRKKILLHSERGEIVPTRAILKTAEQIEKDQRKRQIKYRCTR